jgi:hypothetical protein
MKNKIIILTLILLSCLKVYAKDFSLSGYVDTGKQYSFEDNEDLILDDNYKYTTCNLKLEQKVSPSLDYYISSFLYSKNYQSKNIYDNKARVVTTSLSYDKNKLYKIVFNIKYKEKSMLNNPSDTYKQIKLDTRISRDVKNEYSLKFTGGVNNFDYINISSGNVFNVLGKIDADKYFKSEDITLGGTYKIESSDKKFMNKKQVKQEMKGLFDYKLNKDYFYKFTSKFEYGTRDTKDDDEDVDYDLDYTYRTYTLKTYHNINDDIKTNIKYENMKKDYMNLDLDYNKYTIGNNWSYDIVNSDIRRLWLNLQGEYKSMKYKEAIKNDYNKKQFECDINYKIRDNYKLYSSFEDNIYRNENIYNNKTIYNYVIGIEKYLLNKDLTLGLECKYKYIAYENRNNIGQNGVKLSFDWKF